MALYVDIEKKCGDFLLKVKFTAEKEVLGLLGASGCGKSMTLKCIAGIEKPDRGVIRLDDKVFFDSEKRIHLPVQKRRVGYLFQDYALFPNMTVLQNILCGAGDRKKASEYVKRFFLEGKEQLYPAQLSGGQKQRTAMARMLAGNIPGRTQTMSVAIYTAVQSGDRSLAYYWVAIIMGISFFTIFLMNYWMGYQERRGGGKR